MKEDNKNNYLVSIITPVFNGEKYISQTISSVINQEYQNWELILINDGSNDGTYKIIKEFENKDNRINCISLKESSGGPAKPRNLGLRKARGKYIAFLDSDDLWKKEKLIDQVKEMEQQDYDILSSNIKVINKRNELIGQENKFYFFNLISSFFNSFNCILIYNPIMLSSSICKNNKTLRFREDKNLQSIEDWAFWIDNIYDGSKVGISKNFSVSYRNHEESISKKNGKLQYFKGFFLYGLLLAEDKIGLLKYTLLVTFHVLRTLIFAIKRKF